MLHHQRSVVMYTPFYLSLFFILSIPVNFKMERINVLQSYQLLLYYDVIQ